MGKRHSLKYQNPHVKINWLRRRAIHFDPPRVETGLALPRNQEIGIADTEVMTRTTSEQQDSGRRELQDVVALEGWNQPGDDPWHDTGPLFLGMVVVSGPGQGPGSGQEDDGSRTTGVTGVELARHLVWKLWETWEKYAVSRLS